MLGTYVAGAAVAIITLDADVSTGDAEGSALGVVEHPHLTALED